MLAIAGSGICNAPGKKAGIETNTCPHCCAIARPYIPYFPLPPTLHIFTCKSCPLPPPLRIPPCKLTLHQPSCLHPPSLLSLPSTLSVPFPAARIPAHPPFSAGLSLHTPAPLPTSPQIHLLSPCLPFVGPLLLPLCRPSPPFRSDPRLPFLPPVLIPMPVPICPPPYPSLPSPPSTLAPLKFLSPSLQVKLVGRQRLVLDLSCRKRDGQHFVVTDRWQRFSQLALNEVREAGSLKVILPSMHRRSFGTVWRKGLQEQLLP